MPYFMPDGCLKTIQLNRARLSKDNINASFVHFFACHAYKVLISNIVSCFWNINWKASDHFVTSVKKGTCENSDVNRTYTYVNIFEIFENKTLNALLICCLSHYDYGSIMASQKDMFALRKIVSLFRSNWNILIATVRILSTNLKYSFTR